MSLADLNRGRVASRTLAELLKVDFAKLAATVFPDLDAEVIRRIRAFGKLGILKRMEETARLLDEEVGVNAGKVLAASPSDTARGWAAFLIGQNAKLSLAKKLERLQPFADDPHFGVREWAWMAVRADVLRDPDGALRALIAWTSHASPRVRRFASEATRPRGVWAPHIPQFKADPARGLALLEKLRSDGDKYVRDSVANWLNDAAKDQGDWVKKVCADWERASPTAETRYIAQRAQRSLRKKREA